MLHIRRSHLRINSSNVCLIFWFVFHLLLWEGRSREFLKFISPFFKLWEEPQAFSLSNSLAFKSRSFFALIRFTDNFAHSRLSKSESKANHTLMSPEKQLSINMQWNSKYFKNLPAIPTLFMLWESCVEGREQKSSDELFPFSGATLPHKWNWKLL